MALPTGRVTMLFTDIEGSTRLLRALGASYADVLSGQRRCGSAWASMWANRPAAKTGTWAWTSTAPRGIAPTANGGQIVTSGAIESLNYLFRKVTRPEARSPPTTPS